MIRTLQAQERRGIESSMVRKRRHERESVTIHHPHPPILRAKQMIARRNTTPLRPINP
jgi:hypothetical protein